MRHVHHTNDLNCNLTLMNQTGRCHKVTPRRSRGARAFHWGYRAWERAGVHPPPEGSRTAASRQPQPRATDTSRPLFLTHRLFFPPVFSTSNSVREATESQRTSSPGGEGKCHGECRLNVYVRRKL